MIPTHNTSGSQRATPVRRAVKHALAATTIAAGATVIQAGPLAEPAAATSYTFGLGPGTDLWYAAWDHRNDCSDLTQNKLYAMVFAPTVYEGGTSPMAHGRYDTSSTLYDLSHSHFWHPGIGLWQMDSAGLGRPYAAFERIDTAVIAPVVTAHIASQYCRARDDLQMTPAQARAYAWSDWNGCDQGKCETVFNDVYDAANDTLVNLTKDSSISSRGGMELHTCRVGGSVNTQSCWYINPANAQGDTSNWVGTSFPNPEVKPYYSWRTGYNEWREFWLVDGSASDTHVKRPFTSNARGSLVWYAGKTLCDTTRGAGNC